MKAQEKIQNNIDALARRMEELRVSIGECQTQIKVYFNVLQILKEDEKEEIALPKPNDWSQLRSLSLTGLKNLAKIHGINVNLPEYEGDECDDDGEYELRRFLAIELNIPIPKPSPSPIKKPKPNPKYKATPPPQDPKIPTWRALLRMGRDSLNKLTFEFDELEDICNTDYDDTEEGTELLRKEIAEGLNIKETL